MSAPTWKEKLESIRARHAAASRGPWRWFGYLSNRDVGLEGSGGTVMEFARWGLRGGQPLFSIKGILYDLVKFVVPDTTEGRGRVTDINHPDARFIASSWEDVRDLLARVDELEAESANYRADLLRVSEVALRVDAPAEPKTKEGADALVDVRRAIAPRPPPPPAPSGDTRRDCTCLGTCRGADGLSPGWRCALEPRSGNGGES